MKTKKQKKIAKVMGEFKDKKLKGRDDKTITNPKQAIAIALSQAEKMAKGGAKRDPKVGTGKKPKGSDRRLYTDENPKDTVRIKYATVQDAKETIKKVKNINKPFARKIQILTVLEQRAKFADKPEQARLARKAKESLRKKRTVTASKGTAVMAKNKKEFPDLTGDGKVTQADILKGRGVKFRQGGLNDMETQTNNAATMSRGIDGIEMTGKTSNGFKGIM